MQTDTAHGSLIKNNISQEDTPISNPNDFFAFLFTSDSVELSDFAMPSNGVLKYTGATTTIFRIKTEFNARRLSGSTRNLVGITYLINGLAFDEPGAFQYHEVNSTEITQAVLTRIITLKTGDEITVAVKDTNNVGLSLFSLEMNVRAI